jgi:hypothetical protein
MNIKRKLLITNPNIWFNQQAIANHVPNFVEVKVIGNTPSVIKTQKLVANIRIKEELKFLYKKKSNLNIQLYSKHLQAATYWGKAWYIIENNINESLKSQLDKKYDILTKKKLNIN